MNYFPEEISIGLIEIPGEISLIIPLAGCGHKCLNCHSPHYQNKNNGVQLTVSKLDDLLIKYERKASCVCIFNGEDEDDLNCIIDICKVHRYKVALYTGFDHIQTIERSVLENLDYIKTGHYNEKLGGLDSKTTNQKLFKIENSNYIDITHKFWRNND